MSDYVAPDAQIPPFDFDDPSFDIDYWIYTTSLDLGSSEAGQSGHAFAPTSLVATTSSMHPVALINPSTSMSDTPRDHAAPSLTVRPSWKCEVPGCNYIGSFARKADLRRHSRVKHSHDKPFVCHARGCFRRSSSWAFARPDKLSSHIKALHNGETVFTRCPQDGCDFRPLQPLTLTTLAVHLTCSHPFLSESSRALLNASVLKSLECPFRPCGKHCKHDLLLSHLANSHNTEELLALPASGRFEGFRISYDSQFPISVNFVCPICSVTLQDFQAFKQHFWTHYLFSEGGAEHFRSCCSTLDQHVSAFARSDRNRHVRWERTLRSCFRSEIRTVQCPSCSLWVEAGHRHNRTTLATHHFSLLRPTEEVIVELFPYRMQIVRLYPDFARHPIFADLGPRDGEYYDFVASLASASLSQETPAAS